MLGEQHLDGYDAEDDNIPRPWTYPGTARDEGKVWFFRPGRDPFWLWECAECEEPIANQDEVWVEPVTGVASWEDGWPYHMECAPPEPNEED